MQISYKLVFVIEYLGPLIAFPVIYFLRPFIFGQQPLLTLQQKILFFLFVLHFIKRELETLFVHKFSKGTMPIFNLFKNSGYYSFCGWYIAYFVLHPLYISPPIELIYLLIPFYLLMMIFNFYSHYILANLRTGDSKERFIPKGFLFEYVSCPNYLFEIVQWFIYSIMTLSISAVVFLILGGGQMTIWALGKHSAYKKEFKDYPKNRKVLIPFIF